MKIKLTEKYKPFSHEVGTSLLLPKSPWKATIYPAKILLENIQSIGNKTTLSLIPHVQGPLTQFTVMQDLERQWIRIFGKGSQGYFSYRLLASSHEIILFFERGPDEGISFTFEGETKTLIRKEELIIPITSPFFSLKHKEKIHFGCSKKQDWSCVKRRGKLEEILPIWFELGKNIPSHPILDKGTSRLLLQCQKDIEAKDRENTGTSFLNLFKVGFEGILSPRLFDEGHHGYLETSDEIPQAASPLVLLGEGARLIRSLLIQKKENAFVILPCLPKEIHSGRFINIHLNETLIGDLEWSKKLVRILILRPKKDQEVRFQFQSSIGSFRFRMGRRGRGKECKANESLTLKKDTLYILDRFQK